MPKQETRALLDWNTSERIRETIWKEIKSRESWEEIQGPKWNYTNPYDIRDQVAPHLDRHTAPLQTFGAAIAAHRVPAGSS